MRKKSLVFLVVILLLIFGKKVEAVWPVHDGPAYYQRIFLEANRSAQAASLAAIVRTQDEKNFIQQFIQGRDTLQSVITAAQWAQSTVKGIQDQLSFFNDVRNYIESVEDSIASVTDMYDTIQNAGEDIDKTKTRWNRLMKGNYKDIKGIKEGLSEAASLADNLDDHAVQLEQGAINVSQKAKARDRALDAMLQKAKEINPLKAADPTAALLTKLNIQQNVEQQRMFNEWMFKQDLEKLQKETEEVESGKRGNKFIEDTQKGLKKLKPAKIDYL